MEQRRKRHKSSHPPQPRPPSSSHLTIPLTRSHPLRVQPLGNLYLSSSPYSCIPPGLGLLLPLLSPPTHLPLLSHFDAFDLARLSQLSHAFYVLTRDEELHRSLTLQLYPTTFHFHHSWRLTLIYHTLLTPTPPHHPCHPLHSHSTALSLITRLHLTLPPRIRGFYSDLLFQSHLCSSLDLSHFSNPCNIDRVHIDHLTPTRFLQHYAVPNRPFILTGLIPRWAASRWTPDSLAAAYPTSPFKVGAYSMTLPRYLAYARQQTDESPLYLFDSAFGEKHPELLQGYEVPWCFGEDLFGLLEGVPVSQGYHDGCEDRETPDAHMRVGRGGREGGERGVVVGEDERKEAVQEGIGCMRPAYRWILLGPARSGSTFHKDPNQTSAWNALLHGHKRWILYPPDQPPPGIHISPDGRDVITPISVTEWLLHYYAQHTQRLTSPAYTPLPLPHPTPPLSSLSSPITYPPSHYSPIECLHSAGELLFIPHGWWHLAVNLDLSLAVTQNFVSRQNLLSVRRFVREEGNAELAQGLERRMSEVWPGLVEKLEERREEVERVRREAAEMGGKNRARASLWSAMIGESGV